MPSTDKRIDAYIAKAAPFAQPVLKHLRELIHTACPDVEETIKWSFPNFMYSGAILCNMAAFKEHCAFGFWKASVMSDPDRILVTEDKPSMGHLGHLTKLSDLPKDSILKKYIKEAMRLTDEGVKLPQRQRNNEKKELIIPDYFIKAIGKNKKAQKVFDMFNYSNKKEYIQWITEAKTEATRDKRIATALEWIAEGKGRNWKYEKC